MFRLEESTGTCSPWLPRGLEDKQMSLLVSTVHRSKTYRAEIQLKLLIINFCYSYVFDTDKREFGTIIPKAATKRTKHQICTHDFCTFSIISFASVSLDSGKTTVYKLAEQHVSQEYSSVYHIV